ncbi:MAG TPA: hypothetical protein DIT07_06925 [Sphingobacteriaceae bacterium]|nr:hypothetical protein [Sphingobacteriaceae bacterium]
MDKKVEYSIQAALKQFSKISRYDSDDFSNSIRLIFNSDRVFLEKVAALDSLFDQNPKIESLREIFFDLLLINFFAEDVKKLEEDYLDSKEWEAIEEKTLDRGTEILNLLLYLKECEDEEITPELSDYLNEFLLVDDDEFQDEHRIYEDVIANQILVESSFEEIANVANKLPESSEIKDLFYPMVSFFYEPEPDPMDAYTKHSKHPEFDTAVYALLTTYNKTGN